VDISGLTDDQLAERNAAPCMPLVSCAMQLVDVVVVVWCGAAAVFAQLPPDMLAQRKKALQDWALHLGLEEGTMMLSTRRRASRTPCSTGTRDANKWSD